MEIDLTDETSKKAEALQNIVSESPLQSSLSKLSGSSRGIPHGKDFHFYNNFPEFKSPIKQTDEISEYTFKEVGAASELWAGKEMAFCNDYNDMDVEAYDWLVNVNDEILEKVDAALDEFRDIRKKEEESGDKMMEAAGVEDGFQMVYSRKNRRGGNVGEGSSGEKSQEGEAKVQVAAKVRQKIPFHIPSIPKPQDEYKIIVNNANQPFEHVWLERCADGSPIHPLEKFSPSDFVDRMDEKIEPVAPPPVELTPFLLVEEVKDLKALAAKLRNVDEFAVDLEHNQYRSFQGLTCLMQISTRTEDFIIDTLKLRIQIGPYLRELFKDPTKRKVMHGADRDVLWLQRDFGIYICNMFDTGQASKVLNLERKSLEYLLNHFCGVTANKEYQNADWRLRPLPAEMVRYAREDTHYLLYIYDLMRMRLLSLDEESECPGNSLLEVYKRSYSICMLLYEKDILTDRSFRSVYGVPGAGLSAEQLAVVAGLCEWRDVVARSEDESTGFILPNRTLLEIAKEMPLTTGKLRRFVRSKHPYVERNLGSVVSIIRNSIQNAAAFEAAAQELKAAPKVDFGSENNPPTTESSEVFPELDNIDSSTSPKLHSSFEKLPAKGSSDDLGENGLKRASDSCEASASKHALTVSEACKETESKNDLLSMAGATVEVLKKPSRALGSLLGNSSKRKFQPDKREPVLTKLEEIKSAVSLPFHAFATKSEPATGEPSLSLESSPHEEAVVATSSSNVEDVILLDSDDEPVIGVSKSVGDDVDQKENNGEAAALESDEGEEAMSLSDLSASFQQCFQSIKEARRANLPAKPQEHEGLLQLKPFDYEAARKQVRFGEASGGKLGKGDDNDSRGKGHRKTRSGAGQSQKGEVAEEFPQGKRRQAFPASGNRSATFR